MPSSDTNPERLIRNISDTARWTALYRARETERPDAIFRDPFARALAGGRGAQIAASQPFAEKHSWPFLARTYLFDQFITEEIACGAEMVVNLAAGLDARPYRMNLPASLQWVEVDLPGILDYKEEILASAQPVCRLERVRLDLTDQSARRALFQQLGARASRVLILSEGLLIYLAAEQAATLAQDLAAPASFRRWILDLASPGLLRLMNRTMGDALSAAGAPFRFAPQEGPAYFEPHGWKLVKTRSPLKTAARLRRLPSFGMRLAALMPDSAGKKGNRLWSGICQLERAGLI